MSKNVEGIEIRELTCHRCGRPFTAPRKRGVPPKYCSDQCHHPPYVPSFEELTCRACGCGFLQAERMGRPPTRCADCRPKPPPPGVKCRCKVCGSTFRAPKKPGRRPRYCSDECRNPPPGPSRKSVVAAYMNATSQAERHALSVQLRNMKRPDPMWLRKIECRWDLTPEYLRYAAKVGWPAAECDWCGGLYPKKNDSHRFCSTVCSSSEREGAGRGE